MATYTVDYFIKRNHQEHEAHHITEAQNAAEAIRKTNEFIEKNHLPHAFRPKAKKMSSKEITYIVHGESRYVFPQHMNMAYLAQSLRDLESIASRDMKESGADHAVYAVKKYSDDGGIKEVDFYDPPVCMNDKDFYERTEIEAKAQPCVIYAVHKRK
ncbi:MAG: hypothetical protein RR365_00775 [Bacteroides sp.]